MAYVGSLCSSWTVNLIVDYGLCSLAESAWSREHSIDSGASSFNPFAIIYPRVNLTSLHSNELRWRIPTGPIVRGECHIKIIRLPYTIPSSNTIGCFLFHELALRWLTITYKLPRILPHIHWQTVIPSANVAIYFVIFIFTLENLAFDGDLLSSYVVCFLRIIYWRTQRKRCNCRAYCSLCFGRNCCSWWCCGDWMNSILSEANR